MYAKLQTDSSWFEAARPQVHGYEVNCVSALAREEVKDAPLVDMLISGADEKVLRLFSAPFGFVKGMQTLCGVEMRCSPEHTNEELALARAGKQESSAKQPLGLMNKPLLVQKKVARVDEEEGGYGVENFDPDKILTNALDEG